MIYLLTAIVIQSEAKNLENIHRNERSNVASWIGLTFLPWSGGALWSVKNKKLFERSEFFLFSGIKCRSRQKSAALIFSFCYLFLLHQGKRKSKKHTPKKNIIINRKQKTFFFIFASLGVKKKKGIFPDSQSSLTLNLIPWKTQCKYTTFMLYSTILD